MTRVHGGSNDVLTLDVGALSELSVDVVFAGRDAKTGARGTGGEGTDAVVHPTHDPTRLPSSDPRSRPRTADYYHSWSLTSPPDRETKNGGVRGRGGRDKKGEEGPSKSGTSGTSYRSGAISPRISRSADPDARYGTIFSRSRSSEPPFHVRRCGAGAGGILGRVSTGPLNRVVVDDGRDRLRGWTGRRVGCGW